MTEQPPRLITFYNGWETYQRNLIEVIAPLTAEQLAMPAASHDPGVRNNTACLAQNRCRQE